MPYPQHETLNPTQSSQVQTTTAFQNTRAQPTLRLRGEDTSDSVAARPSSRRRIRWSEDVVNNEGMGRKSSKGVFFVGACLQCEPPPRGRGKIWRPRIRRISLTIFGFSLIIYLAVCCIYHRNRAIGESSSESESDSSESSSSDTDSDRGVKDKKHNAHHYHQDPRQHDGRNILEHGGPTIPRDESSHIKSQAKKRTPNAYERMPKHPRHPSKEPKPETV